VTSSLFTTNLSFTQDQIVDTVGAGANNKSKAGVVWRLLDGSGNTTGLRYWQFAGISGTTVQFNSATVSASGFDGVLGTGDAQGDSQLDLIVTKSGRLGWADLATGTYHDLKAMPDARWRFSGTTAVNGQPAILWYDRRTGAVTRDQLSAGTFQKTVGVLGGGNMNQELVGY
jgi:hypothetical protein